MGVPEQTYYPAWKVRLLVRLEDYGKRTVPASVPKKPRATNATLDPAQKLKVGDDPDAPAGIRRLLVGTDTIKPKGGPQDQGSSSDGLTWTIGSIIPKRVTWNQNGPRMADTATIEIRLADFPLDPRCVKMVGVKLFIGTMPAEDFALGVGGEVRSRAPTTQEGSRTPLNLIGDSFTDANGVERSNLRFQGFVDKWEDEWEEDGEPMIRLECRDNTQLLIDIEAPQKPHIDTGKAIDQAVADYLANFPSCRGLSVEYRKNPDDPDDQTVPVLKNVLAGTAFQPQLGPPPAKGGGGDGNLKVWDYLTDVTGAMGLIIFVDGNTVVIERFKTLMGGVGRRTSDPWRGRTIDGKRIENRRFIYGRNVKSMRIARNYGARRPTNIEVRCYSPRRKKTLVVRFPQKQDRVTAPLPGDGGEEQKWLVWRVSGIEDPEALRATAEMVYESLGRNELPVSIKTKNLASFGGGNADPDLFDFRSGDPFDLLMARDDENEVNTYSTIEASMLVRTRAANYLESLGFDPGFAAAYSKTYADANFQTQFSMRTMSVTCDLEKGVEFSINGVNYITVLMDKGKANAAKQKASQTQSLSGGL